MPNSELKKYRYVAAPFCVAAGDIVTEDGDRYRVVWERKGGRWRETFRGWDLRMLGVATKKAGIGEPVFVQTYGPARVNLAG